MCTWCTTTLHTTIYYILSVWNVITLWQKKEMPIRDYSYGWWIFGIVWGKIMKCKFYVFFSLVYFGCINPDPTEVLCVVYLVGQWGGEMEVWSTRQSNASVNHLPSVVHSKLMDQHRSLRGAFLPPCFFFFLTRCLFSIWTWKFGAFKDKWKAVDCVWPHPPWKHTVVPS